MESAQCSSYNDGAGGHDDDDDGRGGHDGHDDDGGTGGCYASYEFSREKNLLNSTIIYNEDVGDKTY